MSNLKKSPIYLWLMFAPWVSGAVMADTEKTDLHPFIAVDAGVAAFLGGIGLFTGMEKGPLRASLGYYHFKSNPDLGGFSNDFDLLVDYIWAGNVSYFFNGASAEGIFLRLRADNKKQVVSDRVGGARRNLYSLLAGPEIGYQYRFNSGIFITPRLGGLYYLKKPQGPYNSPVAVGDKLYNNDKHKIWDFYYTLDIGYVF